MDSMDRRQFLRAGVAGVSLAATYPVFIGKTALAAPGAEEAGGRALVVIQLSGGNDGLSTVVPYADPAYGRARRVTRIEERAVLKIDERVGLHPNLKEIKAAYDEGRVAIVQGASYPNPTRSHFEAMDVWHAADRSGARKGTGWLGRAADSTCGNARNPLQVVHLGGDVPLALAGEKVQPIAFQNPGGFRQRGNDRAREAMSGLSAPGAEQPAAADPGPVAPLDYLRRVAADASAASATLRQAVQAYRPRADYPRGNRLGEDLQRIAAMIAGGIPAAVYYAALGGFDTHANQRGRHDNLMQQLSPAVGAFLADLQAQGLLDRVLVLAFSEFGRRVAENGSRGTDHGVAAPVFLAGGRVRGGLHMEHPSLTDLDRGDLKMAVDFRRVYATVLDEWLGAPSEKVLGERWEGLPLIRSAREREF